MVPMFLDEQALKKSVVAISAILFIALMTIPLIGEDFERQAEGGTFSNSPLADTGVEGEGRGIPMLPVFMAGFLTLLLGFIIGWLVAWIVLLRIPGAHPGPLWSKVLLGTAALAVVLLALMFLPWIKLPAQAGTQVAQAATYTPYPTHTPIPTYTRYPTDTPVPTYTPLPTFTPLPTSTPTKTPTRTPTSTKMPTRTPTSTASVTPTKEPKATATATARPTQTPTTEEVSGLPDTGAVLSEMAKTAAMIVLALLLIGGGIWEARRKRH
jgi:hypothetical protein